MDTRGTCFVVNGNYILPKPLKSRTLEKRLFHNQQCVVAVSIQYERQKPVAGTKSLVLVVGK